MAEVKQKLDIVAVIGKYISLTKSGRNYKAVCPFHSEKTPSFMVSPELQIFKCFGCGVSGDIFNFVQKIENIDFSKALEILAEQAGVPLEKKYKDPKAGLRKKIYKLNEAVTQFYSQVLHHPKYGKPALAYLKQKRHLSEETITAFRLGYAPDTFDTLYKFLKSKGISEKLMVSAGLIVPIRSGKGYIDKFRGRVLFPLIQPDGKVVGFTGRTLSNKVPKYLNSPETLVFHKSNFLYGLDKARLHLKDNGAVFVEGTVDVISAHQAGIHNVLAPLGTSLTRSQLKLISRYTTDIVFCFDSDIAGINAIQRAIRLAEDMDFNIGVAIVPDKFKDLDEMIQEDPLGATHLLKNAVPVYDFYLTSVAKRYDLSSVAGKKKALRDLSNNFKNVSSNVVLDHYSKEIASLLDINESTVRDSLNQGISNVSINISNVPEPHIERGVDAYLLAVLLKNLDISIDNVLSIVYKLKVEDFSEGAYRNLFQALQEILGTLKDDPAKKGLGIKEVIDYLKTKKKDNLASLAEELFLMEVPSMRPDKELESALERFQSIALKRKRAMLSKQIELAEKAGDTALVSKLLRQFDALSKN